MHATGIGVPVSQAKALVHYMIGAIDGSTFAQMAMAYRFWSGVTVTSSCSKALDFYMKVAGKGLYDLYLCLLTSNYFSNKINC